MSTPALDSPDRTTSAARVVRQPVASARTDAITMVLSTWLLIGLSVDGWAHTNIDQLETFFTPWHGLFYSGFTATAAWIIWTIYRNQRDGRRGMAAIPGGYGLALVGVAIFAIGGLGDMIWHVAFGIEQGVEALFSPTHLVLFVGLLLILTTPLRAAWATSGQRPASLRSFGPALASVTLTTAQTLFMLMLQSALTFDIAPEWIAEANEPDLYAVHLSAVVIVTGSVLVLPVLMMARRWVLPRGAVAILFAVVAVMAGGINMYVEWPTAVGTILAGVLADIAVRRTQRGMVLSRRSTWALGAALPGLLWGVVYAVHATQQPIGLSPELWTGNIGWAVVIGGLLAVLIAPPPVPSQPSEENPVLGQ